MSDHSGPCRQLIKAYEELLPSNKDKIFKDPHVPGSDDKCFRNVISSLVNQATIETQLSVEYAIICQQIAEVFDPVPGEEKTKNEFKYVLTNELQKKFTSIRQGSPILDNHEEHKKLQEEIDFEEDLATRTRLRKELEGRLKSRQKAAGIIKLIGELFNVELINFRVINLCMKDLLFGSQEPSELDIECFHILMTTTGAKLESLQAGKQIVEKYLTRLDTIINSDLDKYNVRTRFLMLEIFQYRANEWQPPAKLERNPNPDPQSIEDSAKNLPIKSKMIEEIKISKILYQELNDVLLHLRPEELIKFIEHFRKITFQSEDQLKGAVKIIFERLMSAPNMLLLYALICKGLSGVTAPRTEGNGVQVTFEELLMLLIQNEIEVQLKLTETFRQISNNTKALQGEKIPRKAAKLREEVENGFKAQARVHRFTVFLGELFNIDFLGSHFIFEYINQLLDPRTVSSTSVEAFCFLFQSIDRKLFREPNNVNWFKRSLSNLNESMKTFQFSFRSQFMFKDLIDKCRIQWKILSDAGLMKEFSEYSRCDLPWNSTLNEDVLWPEEIHKKQESIEESQTNGHASDESVLSYEELSSVQTDLPSKPSPSQPSQQSSKQQTKWQKVKKSKSQKNLSDAAKDRIKSPTHKYKRKQTP